MYKTIHTFTMCLYAMKIRNYEVITVKTSLKGDQRGSLSSLAGILVGVIVFVALLPVMLQTLAGVEATGTAGTLLQYLPLFIVLGVVLAIIGWAIKPLIGEHLGAMTSLRSMMHNERGDLQVAALVSAIVIITVGVIFFPIIQGQIGILTSDNTPDNDDENIGSLDTYPTAKTLADLIPMFYVLALVFLSLGFALRGMGKI